MKSVRMLFHTVYPFIFRILEIGSITPLLSASWRFLPAAKNPARQGVRCRSIGTFDEGCHTDLQYTKKVLAILLAVPNT